MSAPTASPPGSGFEAAASTVTGVAGRALGAAFATLAVVRRPHPVHPHGVVLHGEIRRTGSPIPTGIAWIDEAAGPLPVIARASRSAGVPAPLPDVIGLAVRFDGPEGPADIELASTGVGWPWRFVLRAHRSPSRAHLHAILPYRAPTGPVLLAARTIAPADLPPYPDALADRLAAEPWRLELLVARPRGAWRPFGELELRRSPGPLDPLLRFDAGRRLLPGAREYEWAHRLRQPAYDRVQAE
ncbi:hypothetical protein [Agrococcus sp. Marseille-Q4369]|uniref:hypothetical protein n=1 Tax=Agrococcus sp. Marseille-Q4369 TaxID=2810513 RepID=UPI001B8D7F34|nr:hypothetical protein [Agrococcus sp. Marseille-Q4369]QUW18034.1 hypothetical protein JSQ78_09250 [Agrococcus sp. Marseille-Q4369]